MIPRQTGCSATMTRDKTKMFGKYRLVTKEYNTNMCCKSNVIPTFTGCAAGFAPSASINFIPVTFHCNESYLMRNNIPFTAWQLDSRSVLLFN